MLRTSRNTRKRSLTHTNTFAPTQTQLMAKWDLERMDKKGHCKYRRTPEKQGHDKRRGTEMPGKRGKETKRRPKHRQIGGLTCQRKRKGWLLRGYVKRQGVGGEGVAGWRWQNQVEHGPGVFVVATIAQVFAPTSVLVSGVPVGVA